MTAAFNDGAVATHTTSLDHWIPRAIEAGMRWDSMGRLGIRQEGRVFIASWAEIRSVYHTMGGAVRELTHKLVASIESRSIDAEDPKAMVAGE